MDSLYDLKIKRAIAQTAIYTLANVDDPRQPAAIERLKAQLASIDKEIEEITGRPPKVVIGLNAAAMAAETR